MSISSRIKYYSHVDDSWKQTILQVKNPEPSYAGKEIIVIDILITSINGNKKIHANY